MTGFWKQTLSIGYRLCIRVGPCLLAWWRGNHSSPPRSNRPRDRKFLDSYWYVLYEQMAFHHWWRLVSRSSNVWSNSSTHRQTIGRGLQKITSVNSKILSSLDFQCSSQRSDQPVRGFGHRGKIIRAQNALQRTASVTCFTLRNQEHVQLKRASSNYSKDIVLFPPFINDLWTLTFCIFGRLTCFHSIFLSLKLPSVNESNIRTS